jgi:hypothetical protein
MSSFFQRRKSGSGSFKAPSYDPFNRYANSEEGALGWRKSKNVIIPGTTNSEKRRLNRVGKYVNDTTGKECTVPQSLIEDVYSMYVNDDIKRRPESKHNAIKHKVLNKVYNSLTKVVTKDSPMFTEVLTREMALYLQKISDQLDDEDPDGGSGDGESPFDKAMPGMGDVDEEGNGEGEEIDSPSDGLLAGKGDSNSDRESYEALLDKILNSEINEKALEEAHKNAEEKMEELNEKLGEEALKDLSKKDPEFLEKIELLKHALSRVSINKDSIRVVLEKILDESMNYFSRNFTTVEESIFETDDFEDLFGLEFLHPIFRNAELMNACNASRTYKGKIDLYLDCSGSMSSNATFEGTTLRMIDLVKGIAIVLYRMNMIENLYFFDTSLYKIDNINELTILSFSKSGGTDFNMVVSSINETGNNSVVITDGYDHVSSYTKQGFFVGVGGTTFSNGGFNDYRKSKQCVSYNGNTSKFDYCV